MEQKKMKQYRVLTVIAIFVAAAVMILAVILSRPQPISDDFFVSDGAKLVLKLNATQAAYQTGEYEPDTTYVVYFYDNDKITNARIYFKYNSDEQAEEANAHIPLDDKVWAYEKQLNGKYIVFNLMRDQYANLTTEYVRGIIE